MVILVLLKARERERFSEEKLIPIEGRRWQNLRLRWFVRVTLEEEDEQDEEVASLKNWDGK